MPLNILKMKKRFLFTLVMVAVLASCSSKLENLMTVSGEIDGLKKGTLYLQNIQDSVLTNLDSLEIRGEGNFDFEYEIESPELFYLYLSKADNNDLNDRIAFFGEAGNIIITTSWNQFESDAKIVGSKNHDEFSEYKEMISQFNKRDLELAQSAFSLTDTLKVDSVEALAERNYISRYRYILNFGLSNPSSYVTPYAAITDGLEANPIYLDSIFKALPDSIANSKYGKVLATLIEESN